MAETPEEALQPAQVLHDAALQLLNAQIGTLDALDAENARIIQVSSTVLPLAFGLLAIRDQEITSLARWTLIAALVFYVLVLISAWKGSRQRAIDFRPELTTLERHVWKYTGADLQHWVATEYVTSTVDNKHPLEQKARLVGLANTLMLFEVLCLAIAAAASLLL